MKKEANSDVVANILYLKKELQGLVREILSIAEEFDSDDALLNDWAEKVKRVFSVEDVSMLTGETLSKGMEDEVRSLIIEGEKILMEIEKEYAETKESLDKIRSEMDEWDRKYKSIL
jgi:cell division GTPase FtsZ